MKKFINITQLTLLAFMCMIPFYALGYLIKVSPLVQSGIVQTVLN